VGQVLFLLLLQNAWAGYGVIGSGYPNWGERSLHRWTNAVRVEPAAFQDVYPCDFSGFSETEQSPQALLFYDFNLNDASRFHTTDMVDNGFFSHSSSDGTSFFERVSRYYGESGYVGENIASGYGDTYAAVFYGWMCSDGHRENIMRPDYDELGTGVIGAMYTQDFADGVVETTSPIAMGLHDPESPAGSVSFMADWDDMAADQLEVVLDGRPIPMDLRYGTARLGVFVVPELAVAPGCHSYWFRWTTAARSGSYPELGSYLFGMDCGGDTWTIDRPLGDGDTGDTGWEKAELSLKGCACSTAADPGRLGWLLLAVLVPIIRRR
jgi:MYXO-CTERM domain-containing protein